MWPIPPTRPLISAKRCFEDGRVLSTAYKRPQTMKGGHEWWKYVYDEHYDCVLCPEHQALAYHTTNGDGYREYRSDPKICVNCPTRHLCTHSKDCVKIENFAKHFNLPVRKLLQIASEVNPNYDYDFASEMMERFELDGEKEV